MLDFKRLSKIVASSSYLWIQSPRVAWAFLAALCMNVILVLVVNATEPWRRLSNVYVPNNIDNYLDFSSRFARAMNDVTDDRKFVLLLGGSGSRELSGSERYFNEKLSAVCRGKYHFINAGTSDQTLAESWSIAEATPSGRLAAAVVGLNYYRLGETRDETIRRAEAWRLPFGLPHTLKEKPYNSLEAKGLFQLGWMLKNRQKINEFSIKDASTFSDSDFRGVQNWYDVDVWTEEKKRATSYEYAALYEGRYSDTYKESLALSLSFASDLKSKDVRVSFIALPESPSSRTAMRMFDNQFDEQIDAFDSAGFEVFDWRDLPELSEADFHDPHHIVTSGREKIMPRLLTLIAGQLPDCDASQILKGAAL
jgi:hypothetical protein